MFHLALVWQKKYFYKKLEYFLLVIRFLKTHDVDHAYFTNFQRDCIVLESDHPLKTTLILEK